jgi:Mce-associated membrane protein
MTSTTGIDETLPDSSSETDTADTADTTGSDETRPAMPPRRRLARILAVLKVKAAQPDSPAESEPTDAPPDSADAADTADTTGSDETGGAEHRGRRWTRILSYCILPGVALLLAGAAGYLKWVDATVRNGDVARAQSVQAAIDSTVAMLSYRPDNVAQNLAAARDRMTGDFRDSYSSLTNDVVIPGAEQRQISAVATVPAAASVSATETHAVVLVFVNQTTVIGNGPPTDSASSVRVTLEKVHDHWLISHFDPI